MAQYRVGKGGLRVGLPDGVVSYLPPGTILDEIPESYDGTLIVVQLDSLPAAVSQTNPASGASAGAFYGDKMLRPANSGHGHVRPRPDGVKARCGGPAICHVCALEAGKLTRPSK
jgi:hypothetical protein